MKGLLFIVVLSLLAVGYARDQEEELAIRSQYIEYKGNSCKEHEGRCIKGNDKPCPKGYDACGLSCGKGKKNKNKRCCCLLYLTPIPEPRNSCKEYGGRCIKGNDKPCPKGYDACGLSCGKGKKNKNKRCCCLLYFTPIPEPTCPEGWVENGNQCYFILPQNKRAFEGYYLCKKLGATLPIIKSAEENDFLVSLTEGKGDPRLGMIAPNGDNVFEWLDGTTLADTFSPWDAGEPNNPGSENCVFLYVSGSGKGKWNDDPCRYSRPIVCQMEKK